MTPQELITKSRTLLSRRQMIRGKTKYKYVCSYTYEGVTIYYARITPNQYMKVQITWSKYFTDLIEAAKAC